MTKATQQQLAEMAGADGLRESLRGEAAAIAGERIGRRAAEKFIAAMSAGKADNEDAWLLLANHLHRWDTSDPEARGFVIALARAVAPVEA